MCGIAGWIDFGRDLTQERAIVDATTQTMACRGPDADGVWIDQHAAIGHRRLSVIDLEGGRQPMTAEQDRRTLAVLTFSGEIYNYRELRADLISPGHRFRTESDTTASWACSRRTCGSTGSSRIRPSKTARPLHRTDHKGRTVSRG
ncbi:glutamine amidotransferase-like protein [Streptomyces sp. PanSC19]|nr:hypothetical protein [Streptomyces sp. PanSC19]ROQ26055.1 glutamine amidotransferase-like protein [Streptomyces sp. PanSC19]